MLSLDAYAPRREIIYQVTPEERPETCIRFAESETPMRSRPFRLATHFQAVPWVNIQARRTGQPLDYPACTRISNTPFPTPTPVSPPRLSPGGSRSTAAGFPWVRGTQTFDPVIVSSTPLCPIFFLVIVSPCPSTPAESPVELSGNPMPVYSQQVTI